ncbi:MAG: 2-oxoisovalerate dehydrogenase [Chloroflexi bacterium]|nr:2-oxoisovalerate dehydrogenase [Chloroflexota bacterium]
MEPVAGTEIIFMVEEAEEGVFVARALGYSIFTEADTWDELKASVQDAVACHFGAGVAPMVGIIRAS